MSDDEEPRAVRHVVLFSFRDDAPPGRIREIEVAFAALRAVVPGIVDLEWGTDESPEGLADGFTHCFVVTLADAAARDAYLTHPAHVAFTQELEPILERVLVVDYVPRA
jgi:Stress responsive A/B Barrel Domain